METTLSVNSITFGKYRGKSLQDVLKDRGYCRWLLLQDWFRNEYEYLYNRVEEYNPHDMFAPSAPEKYCNCSEFVENFPYFCLKEPDDLEIVLTGEQQLCYIFYLGVMRDLRNRIVERIDRGDINVYNIKAPTKWLKQFEEETGMSRDVFKAFLYEHDLPNVTSVLEIIKAMGGIKYKGAQAYNIAKKRSLEQEMYWETALKEKYGEDIAVQFKFEECIFDFINIPKNVIYECKLSTKDFNESQYKKYLTTLGRYDIIYLIGRDIAIHMGKREVYLSGSDSRIAEYKLCDIPQATETFRNLIEDFSVSAVGDDLMTLI